MNKFFRTFVLFFTFILLLASVVPSLISPPNVLALPQNFFTQVVASGFNEPVDFTELPDGRILVAEKGGKLKVVENGQVLANPMLSLSVNFRGERGLLGITKDPNFVTNNFIYIFYINDNPLEYHISRFTVNGNSAGGEVVLFKTAVNAGGSTHMGGGIKYGPDGKIWFTIGENTLPDKSQDLNSYFGKLLRINPDGTVPSDNPYIGQAGKLPEIWASGLRNPFRFSFLGDGRPILGDVGGSVFEEVDVGVKGGNYGWPTCEGSCSNPGFVNPIYTYPHNSSGSASISGGFIYTGNQFPQEYTNNYFFGDYVRGYMHRLVFDNNGNVLSEQSFDDTAGTVVSLQQGNDGSIYYVDIYPGSLKRIFYSLNNQAPTAMMSANPTSGDPPLSISFSSNGSSDPEGQNLNYSWDFGDGGTSTAQNPTYVYKNSGKYTAKLIVSDGTLTSQTVSTVIDVGNLPPTVNYISPTDGSKYNAGDVISYSATATDREDGDLPASAFSWTVIFHHLNHIHPFLGPMSGVKSGTFTINDVSERSADTYYEVVLKVKDSTGLETTQSRFIYPNKVNITVNSTPIQNMVVDLNGIPYATPLVDQAVVNFKMVLNAPSPISRNGKTYVFDSWSDGGAQSHTVTIPKSDVVYTANYKEEISTGQNVSKYSVIAGDVKINGQVLYDDDGTTGLVILMEQDGLMDAPWGASVISNPDLQTAEQTLAQVASEVKLRGCGSSCSNVVSFKYPSGVPEEKNFSMVSGEIKNLSKYSVVAGDIKIGGQVLYDDDGTSGLVVLLENDSEVESPWGASGVRNADLQTAESVMQQIVDRLKQSGCGGGCSSVKAIKWPSQK